jgi:cytochrome c-type biogenesis protein CcmE
MTLLSEASFLVTPNGYKASKLYAAIPTNGDGDMTVTRATTATRVDENDLISSVASNVPRIDYTGGGCPSILLEPLRTNIVLNSATVVTQTITTTAVANTLSFYGTGTITLSGTFAGTLVGTGATNRVSLTFTPTAGSLVLTVSGTCTNGQLEAGAYPTSYIPTTTATVTRNADVINRDDIYTNNLITAAGGTWFVHLINNVVMSRDTSNVGLFIGNSSNGVTGDVLAIRNNGVNNRLTINKRIAGSQTQFYTTTTDHVKVAIKWNGTTADVFENGIKVVSATSFTTTDMEFFSGTGGDVSKYIKQMALFPTPLSDAECIALTTL